MQSFDGKDNETVFSTALQKSMIVISWGILISAVFSIGVFMFLGRYVRYLADDFSTAEVLVNQGFWQAQVYWYQSWTGSYLYTFLTSLAELGGVSVAKFLPALAMGLWLVPLFSVLGLVCRVINIPIPKLWRWILSIVIVFCTIRGFEDYSQMIFWQTGIIAYQSNLIIFTLMVAYFVNCFWIRRGHPVSRWEYGVMFLMFFIVGGVCETWIAMQVALFMFGILAVLVLERELVRDSLFRMLVVGLLASCLSLSVTLMAPGNANHASSMDTLSLGRITYFLFVSLGEVPRFLFKWMSERTILLALITVTGFLCGILATADTPQGWKERTTLLKFGVFVFIGGLYMLWAGFFPGFVVFSVRPPDRAIFTSMFIFLWAYAFLTVMIGWIIGFFISLKLRNLVQAISVVLLVSLMYLSPVRTSLSQIRLIPAFQLYAQLWDARNVFLIQAGEQGRTDVVVQNIRYNPALSDLRETIWLIGELEDDPNNWKNQAAARYYGVKSITGQK